MMERRKEPMKVRELIAELSKYDPEGEVGVVAACCGHAHGVHAVNAADDEHFHHDAVVILDAKE